MLNRLYISNYALIDKIEIAFNSGFTTITGESGAGKSIMLEAMQLVLGSRANFNAIRKGETKCVVESEFNASKAVNSYLKSEGLDVLNNVTLRRELTTDGRSRAFINDTPVNLTQMKDVGRLLIDLHGQQENLTLQTKQYQCLQLDIYSGNLKLLSEYKKTFTDWKSVLKELSDNENKASQARKDEDYLRFQLEELNNFDLDPNKFENLEVELNQLEHSEEIIKILNALTQILEDESGLNSYARRARIEAQGLAKISNIYQELAERLKSIEIELNDLSGEVESLQGQIALNPERADVIRESLDEFNRLLHKHNVKSIEDLMEVKREYDYKIGNIDEFDEEIERLKIAAFELEKEVHELGERLHHARIDKVKRFEKELLDSVRLLGMPKAHFELQLTSLTEPTTHGLDGIEMLFNANTKEHLTPINEVASGGEISRLMLALKSIQNQNAEGLTMIFDEIDTGVSGEVAKRIGQLMKKLGHRNQLIAVTHLPGVAAAADRHLKIFKSENSGFVRSQFTYLDEIARVEELASMFSGEQKTEASLETARNLLADGK